MDIKLKKPEPKHIFKVGDIFKECGCIRLISTTNHEEYFAVGLDGNIGYSASTLEELLCKYGDNAEFIGRLEIQE